MTVRSKVSVYLNEEKMEKKKSTGNAKKDKAVYEKEAEVSLDKWPFLVYTDAAECAASSRNSKRLV